ncbi:MAG: hypothetical protein AAF557_26290 [Pseudomonadota bacterium]
MPDGDDDDERGRKDNTGRDHRPKQSQDRDRAPRGHIGTGPPRAPSPGMGYSVRAQQSARSFPQAGDSRDQQPAKDNRPIALKTNDRAVNKEAREQGYRLVKEQDLRKMKDRSSSGDQKPPKDYSTPPRGPTASEFNAKAQDKSLGPGGPDQPKKGRSR